MQPARPQNEEAVRGQSQLSAQRRRQSRRLSHTYKCFVFRNSLLVPLFIFNVPLLFAVILFFTEKLPYDQLVTKQNVCGKDVYSKHGASREAGGPQGEGWRLGGRGGADPAKAPPTRRDKAQDTWSQLRPSACPCGGWGGAHPPAASSLLSESPPTPPPVSSRRRAAPSLPHLTPSVFL